MIYTREEHMELYDKAAIAYLTNNGYTIEPSIDESTDLYRHIAFGDPMPDEDQNFSSFVCDKEEAIEHLRDLTLNQLDFRDSYEYNERIIIDYARYTFNDFFEYVVNNTRDRSVTKVDDGIYICTIIED